MRDHLATLIDDFRRFGRQVAVVRFQGNRRRVATYRELATLAGRFAALLAARGISQGDRVLIWAENSAEWIAAFHGCLLRGVLAVPLDANSTVEFASRVAADVNPSLAVGDMLLMAKLAASHAAPALPTLAFEEWLSKLPAGELGAIAGIDSKTPLEILFTSGTTGDPKGIVLTHGNVLASVGPIEDGARPYLRYEWLVHPLRILHTLPLSHVFGQAMGLWVPPIFAGEVHFESRLAAPHLVELIRKERISVLAAVPRVVALLKAHLEVSHEGLADLIAASPNLGPLGRWWRFRRLHREFGLKFWAFVAGGGALPASLEHFWNALGFVLVQGYGMTETTAIITLNHPFHVSEGTLGKPLAGREVKLAPDGEVLVRGDAISGATWSAGALHPRKGEWLATGDIAERQPSGELRFLGRKSEVIVTAAGVNLHPEDIESAIEEQPDVAACAVVAIDTAAGPEPCAVLACRGSANCAETSIARANATLPEFQRISRWVLWPEPDLPRTPTGKVRRKPVAAWLAQTHSAAATTTNGASAALSNGASSPSSDWLLSLITQVTGETQSGVDDESRLTEDMHLDSLGRVQLAAAIEDRLGIVQGNGLLEEVQTLGELRKLVAGDSSADADNEAESAPELPSPTTPSGNGAHPASTTVIGAAAAATNDASAKATNGTILSVQPEPAKIAGSQPPPRVRFLYPTWPWLKPIEWIRNAYIEAVARPLTQFLIKPQVVRPAQPLPPGPVIIIANHVTSFDGAIVQYALPAPMRRRIAAAMLGEMLEDFRHWRNPWRVPADNRFYIFGKPSYFLLTALYNVFPLPRQRDFQASFAHAGNALDHGYNVLIFPEGALSAEGQMARFRPGIGLLVKQSDVPVVPIAIRGLGELKTHQRKWFRSGTIEVIIGDAIRFGPADSEAAITARLHNEVERLLTGNDSGKQLGHGDQPPEPADASRP